MSAGYPPGFGPPGAPPGFAPAAAPPGFAHAAPAGTVDFVITAPADPTWQPMEFNDVLEKDGFYQCRIVGEKVDPNDGKVRLIMTLEIIDADAAGKKVSRFLEHPNYTKNDVWWKWRGLYRSISGTVQHGQAAFNYAPGSLHGQICYVKTGAYLDNKGTMRTGVENWSTREEWEEAYKKGVQRWAPKPSSPSPGVGALPGGIGGLPGAPSMPGLPGAPAMPGLPGAPMMSGAPAPGVPAPGAAPMQPPMHQGQMSPPAMAMAPPAAVNPFGAPPAAPPAAANPFGPPPAATAPPAFGFAPPAAPAPIPFQPPAPGNGVPQPTAAGLAANFPPGAPPR